MRITHLQKRDHLRTLIRSKSSVLLCGVAVLTSFCGCSHAPRLKDHSEAQHYVMKFCSPRSASQQLSGSIWIKIKNKIRTGQFPASVRFNSDQSAQIEIQNLIGAKVASIDFSETRFILESNVHNLESVNGGASYLGISNRWILALLGGEVPCPINPGSSEIFEVEPGQIAIRDSNFSFRYFFNKTADFVTIQKILIESLSGKKFNVKLALPNSWEIESSEGSVAVRWRDRKVI